MSTSIFNLNPSPHEPFDVTTSQLPHTKQMKEKSTRIDFVMRLCQQLFFLRIERKSLYRSINNKFIGEWIGSFVCVYKFGLLVREKEKKITHKKNCDLVVGIEGKKAGFHLLNTQKKSKIK